MTAEEEKDILTIKNHFEDVVKENNAFLAKSNVNIERELELESDDVADSKIVAASKMGQNGLAASIIEKLDSHLKKYQAESKS